MSQIILPDYILKYVYSLSANELCYVACDLCYNILTPCYGTNTRSEVLSQLAKYDYEVVDSGYMYGGNLYITIKF